MLALGSFIGFLLFLLFFDIFVSEKRCSSMKAEQRKHRNRMIERFIQGLLMIVLIVLTIFMMIDVDRI